MNKIKIILLTIFLIKCSLLSPYKRDYIFVATNDKYCLIDIQSLLSNNSIIDFRKYNITYAKNGELEPLSNIFSISENNWSVNYDNIENKYISYLKKAYNLRNSMNEDIKYIRKKISTGGDKDEISTANSCKNGYNFIHNGLAKMNDSVYFYAGKGDWKKYHHEKPAGEYPLCSKDIKGNVKLITVRKTYGKIYTAKKGDYILIKNLFINPDLLYNINIKNNKNELLLSRSEIIGELNDTQSLIYNDSKEIYIFDHVIGKIVKISELAKNISILGVEFNDGDYIREWNAVASSQNNNIIILRGYDKDEVKKEYLIILLYDKVNNRFNKYVKEIDMNFRVSYIIFNDNPFIYDFNKNVIK